VGRVGAVPRRNLPVRAGRPAFLKKKAAPARGKQKTFDHFGFGLSGLAEAKFRKSFLLLFFKEYPDSVTVRI
jgi:hypothetical protein